MGAVGLDYVACLVGLAALAHHQSARAQDTKSLAVALAALAVLALRSPRWLRQRTLSPETAALCLATGWLAFSLAWSPAPRPAALAPWLGAAAIALASAADEVEAQRRRGAWAATIVLVGSALLWLVAPEGGHGNPNWLAITAAVALPLALEGAVRAARWVRLVHGGSVLCGAALLTAGASRSALAGLAAAALWVAPGRWKLVAAIPVGFFALLGREAGSAFAGRLVLYGDALAAARWPLGVGLGGFPHAFLEAQGARLSSLSPDLAAQSYVNATTAHNDLLQLLVEGGPVAAALVLVLLVSVTLRLRARWPGGSALVVVIFVAGLGDAPLTLPAVAGLFGLVVAACPRRSARSLHGERLVGVALGLALAALLPRLVVSWTTQRALARAQAAGEVGSELARELFELDPGDGEIALALGLALLDEGRAADALDPLRRSRESLANLGTELALGRAHLELADAATAVLAFRRAVALHPGSFRAWIGLAEAHRAAGELDAAAAALVVARDLRPGDPRLRRITESLRRDRIDAASR